MIKKLYLILCSAVLASSVNVQAQCSGGRYIDQIFPSVTKTTVTYSTPFNLQMDVYEPTGDVATARPLIVLAHGGSFISGTRIDDLTIDSLCVRFAKRGYVTASIDYRLSTFGEMISPDSTLAIAEVVKAISDGKAALRYFVKDASTTNTYKIDTNNIYAGGNSAGAVLYMHVGYLQSFSEYPSFIADTVTAHGGFEGESGNAGYTTKIKGVVNCAGALNNASFVDAGDKPSVNFQGTADNVVPYYCAYPLNGFCQVQLCGMGVLEGALTTKGVYHMSQVFPGDSHVPWSSNAAKFKTVDSLTTVFLYSLVCTGVNSVADVSTLTDVDVYPNPASTVLNIATANDIKEITLTDATGRLIYKTANVYKGTYELNTASYAAGLYFVKVTFNNDRIAPTTRRVVLE